MRKPAPRLRSNASVEAEVKWFVWVCQWGMRRGLVPTVATIDVKTLKETLTGWPTVTSTPRPMQTEDRYQALRAVVGQVQCAYRVQDATGRWRRVFTASPLPELLDATADTGHRISAVINLRVSDYLPDWKDPEDGTVAPYGAIRWRAEYDKMRREHVTFLGELGYRAIRRLLASRDRIGDAPLFPSRDDPMHAITRHVAYDWIRKAEKLAGLAHVPDLAWHGFRVKYGTDHKGDNPTDVAAQGGWKTPGVLVKLYQRPTGKAKVAVATGRRA